MSEHIKPFRLFHAEHLLPVFLWLLWVGLTGVGVQGSCSSPGCNQQWGIPSLQFPMVWGTVGGRFHSRKKDCPDYAFLLMPVCIKDWLSPSVLKLAPVNFKNFLLFCSAQKKPSFHKHSPSEKVVLHGLDTILWTSCCSYHWRVLPAFLLPAFLFDSLFIYREKYLI